MATRDAIGDGTLGVSGRELLADIGIDSAELRWRKEFIGFDDADAERLASLSPVVDENLDALVDAFNDYLYGHDKTREVLARSDVARVDDRTYMDRDSQPQEITSLVGREVYTKNGVFLGEVEDLRLNLDAESVTGLALHELNRELFAEEAAGARGVIVPYRWVQAVGDVIIVNDIAERIQRSKAAEDDEEVTA